MTKVDASSGRFRRLFARAGTTDYESTYSRNVCKYKRFWY